MIPSQFVIKHPLLTRSLGRLLLLFFIISCSSPDDRFVLQGKFKNINQGELLIYNMEMGRGRMDTVRLTEGKFTYEIALDDSVTLGVIFPNFSEIPVFAQPGKEVQMAGDASNLKEVTVTGTPDNDLMSTLQLELGEMSPVDAAKKVAEVVKEHPTSLVSLFLIKKYYLLKAEPDYAQAAVLLSAMAKASPRWTQLQQLLHEVELLKASAVGERLPSFSAVTIDGARVTDADLSGTVNVVCAWSSWNFDSQNMQRMLKPLKREYGSRLQLMSFCLDATVRECRSTMRRDSITWPTVCDGQMWQSPAIAQLGITEVPTNIVVDRQGRVVARNLSIGQLLEKIREMMK